jgi:hypothetical protein
LVDSSKSLARERKYPEFWWEKNLSRSLILVLEVTRDSNKNKFKG